MNGFAPPAETAPTPPILVVDDEEIVLAALRETLRMAGYEVVTKSNPLAALDELRQREFSVIISDQRMPSLSGLELLAQARMLRPNTTRILITAVLSLDTVIEAINQGEIFRFIVKPWLREEFLATVKNGMQRYELICQNTRLQATTQSMNQQLVELNRALEQHVQLVERQNQQLGKMNESMEANFVRSLDLSVHVMQTFYPSLGNQSRRVAQLCLSLGAVLGLSNEERRALESAARLHDIGLVGVPRQIIRRWQENPSALDPAEQALIGQHPILGQELAAFDSGMNRVGEIIRAHHERFDGSGYPDALRGESIPWLARILAVAVGYTSSRLMPADALEEAKLGAGAAYDPEAVRALLRALPLAPLPRKEKEISLAELRPGMVLAQGVYTGNGLLLMPEGQPLNATFIEKILNHNRVQPITQSLVVYC
jgi:response regulator RpfG family c-di-GMP phosphodiesterase